MSVTFIPNEEVVAVFCIFWSVSPYIYKKSMEIIVQKRDKTSAVSVIHVYLRSTDLIFLLAKSHFSYSRSMIWQKLFRIFSSTTVNSREKNYTTGKFSSVNGFWFYTQQQANSKIMEKTVWWSLCEKRHKKGKHLEPYYRTAILGVTIWGRAWLHFFTFRPDPCSINLTLFFNLHDVSQ